MRVAAYPEGEGPEAAGGRGRDGAGEDRDSEEESPERHGGANGAEGRSAGQSHRSGNGAQVGFSFWIRYTLCTAEIIVTVFLSH